MFISMQRHKNVSTPSDLYHTVQSCNKQQAITKDINGQNHLWIAANGQEDSKGSEVVEISDRFYVR